MLNSICLFNCRQWTVLIVFFAGCFAVAGPSRSIAQERTRFDPEAYLKGLDVNGSGKLEPTEITGRTEGFLKGMGLDTSQPLLLTTIMEKINKDRKDQETKDSSSKSSSKKVLKVPAFGAVNEPVPSFGATANTALDTTFSDEIIRQVDEALSQYDRNRNSQLEKGEIEQGRWGQPPPAESDTNGDGKLSRIELANRYRAREQYNSRIESTEDRNRGDRDDSGNRQQEDKNRGGGDRGRFGNSASGSAGSESRSSSTRGFRESSSGKSPESSRGTSSSTPDNSSQERYKAYAESLIKNYDKDSDGKLSAEEVKAMRRPPQNADPDNDGFITKDELTASLSGSTSTGVVATPAAARATEGAADGKGREKPPTADRPAGSVSKSRGSRGGGSFSDLDTNQNNQIEMHEFSTDWDDEKLAQFYAKDKNGDGVITQREWNSD